MKDDGFPLQPYVQAANPAIGFPDIKIDGFRSVSNADAPMFNRDFSYLTSRVFQSDIEVDIPFGIITATSAFRRFEFANSIDADASPRPVVNAAIDQDYRQFSQEIRLNGSSGKFDYNFGAYYQRDKLSALSLQNFNLSAIVRPLPSFARYITFDQITKNYSLFGNFVFHLTSTLSIDLGARYSHLTKTADQTSNPAKPFPGFTEDISRAEARNYVDPALTAFARPVIGAPHDFAGLKLSEDQFQPQVVIQYRPDESNMLYAKFVHGAKAGGFDWSYGGIDSAKARFRPETASSIEIGMKGRTSPDFGYSVALFTTTFKDLQVSQFDGVSTFVVSNAGKARTRGVEIELNWVPLEGLRIDAEGAFLDAEYLNFTGAGCYFQQTAATPSGTVCRQDLSGEPTQFASRWSGRLSVGYEHSISGGAFHLRERVAVYAKSKYNAGTLNNPLHVQEGYAQIDASLEFSPSEKAWTLAIFGRNLTDRQYMDFATATVAIAGGEQAAISRGRQIGIRASLNF